MIAMSQRSMMNVAESAKRRSDSGASRSVPKDVIQSPTM